MNKYVVRIEHPILRPGLSITTEVSGECVVRTIGELLDIVYAARMVPEIIVMEGDDTTR